MAGVPFRSRRAADAPIGSTMGEAIPAGSIGSRRRLAPVISLRRRSTAGEPVDEVYEQEHLGLFRFVKGVVRDQELAEDILQETFLRLVRATTNGDPPENTHAWLYRVATNLAISRARRSQTMVRHMPELAARHVAASPEHWVLQAERDEALRSALGSLPVEMRAAIVLASNGSSAREIGAALGKSEGAVRMLLSRGRLRVRRLMAAADVARSGGEGV